MELFPRHVVSFGPSVLEGYIRMPRL